MLKIICLVRLNPAQVYFLNRIHRTHKIALAIVESPLVRPSLLCRVQEKGVMGSLEDIAQRLLKGADKRTKDYAACDRFFGDQWRTVHDDIPILTTHDINSKEVYELLAKEKPDLILDHGTSLVKDHILDTAGLALNLHWGLSPYYRGAYCTEWALLNWDPHQIGVTIHKLAKEIDGGDLLAQKRAVISSGDTVHSINMQLTKLGVDLILTVIDRLKAGQKLVFHKQDHSLGLMTSVKQWSRRLRKQVEDIEHKGLVKEMLARPARREKLPIIEL